MPLYFSAFGQLGGPQRWTNYLIVGGRLIGIHVENGDETTLTRYFHTDHLGSVAVITNETGGVMERLSYDAWGLRRHPDGTPDPSGSIASQSTRGFTGHEHLADVGLIHMNGRVYDPLLARFGTPDPMTESPFSTQGWNRYTYVGNSPVNFTDPTGYCFLGCFWKPMFKAIGNFFKQSWGAIVQIAAGAICSAVGGPGLGQVCAAAASAIVTGITSGNLGMALRAGITAYFTAEAFNFVGTATLGVEHKIPDFLSPKHLANIAGHALVGCASAAAQGGKCGPGALSAAAGSFAGPILKDLGAQRSLVAHAVVGGLASVAGGGNFANGAVTASFGYLFNEAALLTKRDWTGNHSALFIWNNGDPVLYDPAGGYPGTGDPGDGVEGGRWTGDSASIEAYKKWYKDAGYDVEETWLNTSAEDDRRMVDWIEKDQGANYFQCTIKASQCLQQVPSMKNLGTFFWPSQLKAAVRGLGLGLHPGGVGAQPY